MASLLKSIGILVLVFMCGFLFFHNQKTPPIEIVPHNDVIEEVIVAPKVSFPTELSIERIGIQTPIESVGVLDGAMAVPTRAENVGWYALGTVPGQIGSAVLAGHVNWKDGGDAAFTRLKDIQIGDTLRVTNNDGGVDYFIVYDAKRYPLDADTSEIFSSNDGSAHLNLITCDGVWDPIRKTHESRLVVFAKKM